jgi:hypothetical protein
VHPLSPVFVLALNQGPSNLKVFRATRLEIDVDGDDVEALVKSVRWMTRDVMTLRRCGLQ